MGNRAVITTAPFSQNRVGIYVHWNGGRESIDGFLQACRELEYRAPGEDASYGLARLTQAIGCYFGGTTSLGIGLNKELDCDNGDNGVYLIGGNWEIVGRKFGSDGDPEPKKTAEIASTIVARIKSLEETV